MLRKYRATTSGVGILILVIVVMLRFWHLDAKPLWIDELYTSFYSLGKDPAIVPLNQLLPLSSYRALLTLASNLTPLDAANAVTTYSNHPPVFFMLMQGWMHVFGTSVMALRSLPALVGVLLVAAVGYLGRSLGRSVGWMAAVLMAVSPFGVYLSQEARHYTLPMLVSALALCIWLSLLRSLHQKQPLPWNTLGAWVLLNGLGFYTHYFYVLGTVAQWVVTIAHLYRWRSLRQSWVLIGSAMMLTGLCYLAWLPVILQQTGDSSDATQWLNPNQPLGEAILLPWLRSLAAWVMMVILLPVEQVPLWITIPAVLIMIGVWGWGVHQLIQGWRAWSIHSPQSTRMVFMSLWLYVLIVVALMMGIVYGLNKDLTLAPRYFFILYPALTVVMAAGWSMRSPRKLAIWAVAGVVSILLMGWNWTLLKPYWPENVGQRLAATDQPTMVIMVAQEPVRRLLGLSYALSMPRSSEIYWGFVTGIPESGDLRSQSLQGWEMIPSKLATLWLLEPQRQNSFPTHITLPQRTCVVSGESVNTQGTRQQLYQCQ